MKKQVEYNTAFRARARERGLVKLQVWVPEGDRRRLLDECQQLRDQHLQAYKEKAR